MGGIMSVLLQNSVKPEGQERRGSDVGVSFVSNISKLSVCFGGFSPTSMSGDFVPLAEIEVAEGIARERRESLERAAALEAARASEERAWCDDAGVTWRYVVLDDAEVRIVRCELACGAGATADAAGAGTGVSSDALTFPASAPIRLSIPAAIEGKPVVALANDACAFLPHVEEVVCPDTLLSIGFCAFRNCKALRRIAFPRNLVAFDSDWLRGCSSLEHVTLPGGVEKIDASLFDAPSLKSLVVGAQTSGVEPGTFVKSRLERIEVDASNPFLVTDGRALYTRDGSVMVALAVPCAEYAVRPGTRGIAKKAFSLFTCTRRIDVPDGLEIVGEFAFSRTGIGSFEAPRTLTHIMEKAFFSCEQLECVQLNEGLEEIGADAFTRTGLRALDVPASVRRLGNPLATHTALVFAGPQATFRIGEGTPEAPARLTLDAEGGMYRQVEGGLQLVRMMNPEAERYAVRAETTSIGEDAFANHEHIAEVVLPEGLARIEQGAFRGCRLLARADLPASVRHVGRAAFLDTSIERLRIPAGLTDVEPLAFITCGAHHGVDEPTLRTLEVESGNERFYTTCGLLIERKPSGGECVVLGVHGFEEIRIPPTVDEIAPYALNGLRDVRRLYLAERIETVGIRGLSVEGRVDLIHVDLSEPVGGHAFFDIEFPHTDRGAQQQMLALSVPSNVSVSHLFEHYDNAVINASSFDALSEQRLSLYEQTVRIVERLCDPVYLDDVRAAAFRRSLRTNLANRCVAAAKRDDRRTIDALLDLGLLNADNLLDVIERVGTLRDAAMTNYLLEVKRLRFGGASQSLVDLDLFEL